MSEQNSLHYIRDWWIRPLCSRHFFDGFRFKCISDPIVVYHFIASNAKKKRCHFQTRVNESHICISLPSGLRNVDALKRSCVSNYWNRAMRNSIGRSPDLMRADCITDPEKMRDVFKQGECYLYILCTNFPFSKWRRRREENFSFDILAFCIHRKALRLLLVDVSSFFCSAPGTLWFSSPPAFPRHDLILRSINSKKFAPRDRSKSASTIEGDVKKSIDSIHIQNKRGMLCPKFYL